MYPTEHPGRGRGLWHPHLPLRWEQLQFHLLSLLVFQSRFCVLKKGVWFRLEIHWALPWSFHWGLSRRTRSPCEAHTEKGGMKITAPEANSHKCMISTPRLPLGRETKTWSLLIWGSISWLHIVGYCLVSFVGSCSDKSNAFSRLWVTNHPISISYCSLTPCKHTCSLLQCPASSEAPAYPEGWLMAEASPVHGVSPLRVSCLPPEPWDFPAICPFSPSSSLIRLSALSLRFWSF